jgi:hypothetical protein
MTASTITPAWGWPWPWAILLSITSGLLPRTGISCRLGKALIAPLDDSRGPYVRLDSAGYQMLLDYHGGSHRFPFKSIGEDAANPATAQQCQSLLSRPPPAPLRGCSPGSTDPFILDPRLRQTAS